MTDPSTTTTLPVTTTIPECHEGDDCWDCTVMGNMICGNPCAETGGAAQWDTDGMFLGCLTAETTAHTITAEPVTSLPVTGASGTDMLAGLGLLCGLLGAIMLRLAHNLHNKG